MKFTAKKLTEQGRGLWTVTIEGQDWKNAIEKAKKRVASSIQIPGFRKGKAPKAKIDAMITPGRYLNEALKIILEPAWEFAKAQNSDIQPFNSPAPVPSKISEDICEIEFTFDLKPEIKIGTYKGIKDKELTKEPIKVTKEELEKSIDQYRDRFAMEKLKDGDNVKIESGDVVKFDFEGFVDGKTFKGGKGLDFVLTIGSDKMIPGFETAMIGHGMGASEIKVTFPKDYTEELSEKEATFKLDVKEIKTRTLPAKDDELAKDLNIAGVTTYKELEKYVKDVIAKNKTTQLKNIFVNKVIELIAKNSTIEIPKAAIDKEVVNLFKEFEGRVAAQKITMKEYKKQSGMTDDDIKKELFSDAKARLESYLITDKVRNEEKFNVSDKEINDKYAEFAKTFGTDVEYLKNSILPETQIREELIREKLVDFLYENNGETKAPAAE
jgi:trigger factor